MTQASAQELLALAERCEAATGPDRELDALIAPYRGLRVVDEGHPLGRCCYDATGRLAVLPSYTASIDAAMSLVPEGRILRHYIVSRHVPHTCEVAVSYGHGGWIGHSDHSFALALCAAALRAHATISEQNP